MDKATEDEEIVRLLDVKDIEFIEASELIGMNENDKNAENTRICDENGVNYAKLTNSDQTPNGIVAPCTERRSDEPTELSFEKGDPFALTIYHYGIP